MIKLGGINEGIPGPIPEGIPKRIPEETRGVNALKTHAGILGDISEGILRKIDIANPGRINEEIL